MKDHGKPCKTLYIPEDFDLNVALDTVTGLSRINLEKTLELGIQRNVIKDKMILILKY